MEMVRNNMLGLGEVVRREVVNGFPYLWVRYENGTESKLGIPYSFTSGAVEALGALKDEVNQVIAEKMARLATPAPAATLKKSRTKNISSCPTATAFEIYLIMEGYKVETDSGDPSTVYSYVNAVESVLEEEGLTWDALKANISATVSKYDVGGEQETFGAKSNRTVISALKCFENYVNKP
jgi:hypothetical protein